MRILKRELLLCKKKTVFWVLLGLVVFLSYFGYLDYVYHGEWHAEKMLIESMNKTEEEKEALQKLLWKTMVAFTANNNIMNVVIVVFLIAMSFGADIYTRRISGMQKTGMKLWQIYGSTFLVHYFLALFLILLGAFIPFLRLRELWWGRIMANDLSFFLRPLLELCLETFCFVSTAMLCCSLTAKKNPALPYIVYLILMILLSKLTNIIACYFAYGTTVPIDGQGFRAYYFYDIDQMGLENHFSPSMENPWERKIWGEIRLLEFAVSGVICSVIGWLSFHYQYKRK